MGASGGGEAAFRISGGAPSDQVIAFNPAFPADWYCSPENFLRAVLDLAKLFRRPGVYLEAALIALGAAYLVRRNRRLFGPANVPDTLQDYLRRSPPARATVFYSQHCRLDAEQARRLSDTPSILLSAVDSDRHNCMADLKERGQLGKLIHAEIEAGFKRWQQDHHGNGEQA